MARRENLSLARRITDEVFYEIDRRKGFATTTLPPDIRREFVAAVKARVLTVLEEPVGNTDRMARTD